MDNRKYNKRSIGQLLFLIFLIIGTILIIRKQQNTPYQHDSGMIFGTMYNVTYQSDRNLGEGILSTMKEVDSSLSMFNQNSTISKINRNEHVEPDRMFIDVFKLAQDVAKQTDGSFDITVAPLVNAWGFGFKKGKMPTQQQIDSLLTIIGYQKVKYIKKDGKGTIVKNDPRIMLDCSAIAKGYGSDAVARYLESQGVKNYMVEIGGEVVTKGINSQQHPWRIGISKPVDDTLNVNQDIQTILNVKDMAMATSGNYRNFDYKNGKKYAHTIDPQTGRPVQHSLLSATVLAPNCATADAYATAFMVMGIDKAKHILHNNPEIMAYFIFSDDKGATKVWYSEAMKEKLTN